MENKQIIWEIYVNEFEFIPNVSWLASNDIYKFLLKDEKVSDWSITSFSFTGALTDLTEAWMVKDILNEICWNKNYCNWSTNYNWTILNNYIYRRFEKNTLVINLKSNSHIINWIDLKIQDWFPKQFKFYKWQVEPISKNLLP